MRYSSVCRKAAKGLAVAVGAAGVAVTLSTEADAALAALCPSPDGEGMGGRSLAGVRWRMGVPCRPRSGDEVGAASVAAAPPLSSAAAAAARAARKGEAWARADSALLLAD